MLQLQSQNALIAKDSNVLSSKNFACIIGAPVDFTGLVPKTAILGNFWSRRGRPPLVNTTCLFFTEHIPGEDEYRICIKMRLHVLFQENIICITFRLYGKLVGPDFPQTFPTLTPGCPGVRKFLPITRAAGKRTYWCGHPWCSASGFSKNFVQEHVALILWPLELTAPRREVDYSFYSEFLVLAPNPCN